MLYLDSKWYPRYILFLLLLNTHTIIRSFINDETVIMYVGIGALCLVSLSWYMNRDKVDKYKEMCVISGAGRYEVPPEYDDYMDISPKEPLELKPSSLLPPRNNSDMIIKDKPLNSEFKDGEIFRNGMTHSYLTLNRIE